MAETKGSKNIPFPRFPSHAQAVELPVKTLTEVSVQVCDKKARGGLVKPKNDERKLC